MIMMSPPSPILKGGGCDSGGEGRDGRRRRGEGMPLSTHDLKTCRGAGVCKGGGKRQPKQTSWRHFAKHTKINHCPMVALTFVGSDTQHDRLEGEDERRVRWGGLGKQGPLSLAVIMCARVCVYMWTCECLLCFLPSKTRYGQTAKWCSDGWPGLAVAAARSGWGRPAKWVDRTSATDQHTDWPDRTHTAWGSDVKAHMVHMVYWSQNEPPSLRNSRFIEADITSPG